MSQKPTQTQIKNPECPYCRKGSIKAGKKKNKLQIIQVYQCKSCNKKFTLQQVSSTYPINIILTAISKYNLGYSLKATSKMLNDKFKTNITEKTIHNWVNKFNLPYERIRSEIIESYDQNNIIFKKPLQHKQVYLFQYHKAKLNLILKHQENPKFNLIKYYMEKIPTSNFPHHIFKDYSKEEANQDANNRASKISLKTLGFRKLIKKNYATKMASLALNLAKNNKQRHKIIQDFFLANDSTTIAVEIPVYLTNDDIKYFKSKNFTIDLEYSRTPITGHIDILQLRNNLIHILDYKPEADKNSISESTVKQLSIYALSLASKTKLAVKDFKCAFFNENFYYEFFPLHALYEKRMEQRGLFKI